MLHIVVKPAGCNCIFDERSKFDKDTLLFNWFKPVSIQIYKYPLFSIHALKQWTILLQVLTIKDDHVRSRDRIYKCKCNKKNHQKQPQKRFSLSYVKQSVAARI